MSSCYCTLVMANKNYLKGAIILAYALRKYGADHDIVCMVTPDVSAKLRELAAPYFDTVVEVPYLEYPTQKAASAYLEKLYGKWIGKSYTKFNCLNLEKYGYKRCIFLDADLLPLGNIDELFKLPYPAAIFNRKDNGDIPLLRHGEKVKNDRLSCDTEWNTWSAEVMLLPCSTKLYDQYVAWMKTRPKIGTEGCVSGADEMSLATFWLKYVKTPAFNIDTAYAHKLWNPHLSLLPPKILSFMGDKPFLDNKQWPDFDKWWKLVDEAKLRKLFTEDFNKN